MSNRRFVACLAVVIVAGLVYRLWLYTPPLPDLPVDEYIRRGEALQKERNFSEAIRYHSAALAKEPRNLRALTSRAAAYISTRQIEFAMHDLDYAIRFSKGKYRDSYLLRAYIFEAAGEFDLALADANRAVELGKSHADGYVMRGLIYLHPRKGDRARARHDYETAVTLAPELRGRLGELEPGAVRN